MADRLRPAIFLDRDGTIIRDRDYLGDPDEVELLPGAAQGIARFNRADWPVIVVSNQSGIGRGFIRQEDYEAVTARMTTLLAGVGAAVTAIYHCPHAPDSDPPCTCRKPLPGLFLRAAAEHHLDLASSHYVGDRIRDISAGMDFGGHGYLLTHGEKPAATGDPRTRVVDSIEEVADLVLAVDEEAYPPSVSQASGSGSPSD